MRDGVWLGEVTYVSPPPLLDGRPDCGGARVAWNGRTGAGVTDRWDHGDAQSLRCIQ